MLKFRNLPEKNDCFGHFISESYHEILVHKKRSRNLLKCMNCTTNKQIVKSDTYSTVLRPVNDSFYLKSKFRLELEDR